jgi:hypothetical protein
MGKVPNILGTLSNQLSCTLARERLGTVKRFPGGAAAQSRCAKKSIVTGSGIPSVLGGAFDDGPVAHPSAKLAPAPMRQADEAYAVMILRLPKVPDLFGNFSQSIFGIFRSTGFEFPSEKITAYRHCTR